MTDLIDGPIETLPWDLADSIESEEDAVACLQIALEEGDPVLVARVLGAIARARGMTGVARETGLARHGLYKSLSADGNPSFGTILKVMEALGLKLTVEAAKPAA